MKRLSAFLLVVCLCGVINPPPLGAKPRIGFGGLAGLNFAYRNQDLRQAGLPRPDHLNALGGQIRIPAGSVEVAVLGLIEWRTLHYRDSLGGVDLASDQLSLAAGIRRTVVWKSLEGFLGAGPAAYRPRFNFDPVPGRTSSSAQIKLGIPFCVELEPEAEYTSPCPCSPGLARSGT